MTRAGSRSKSKKAKTSERPAEPEARGPSGSRVAEASEAAAAVTPEERRRIIAEAAYYRAEQRRFIGGDPLQDWLEAEAEVAIRLRDLDPQDGKPTSS